MSPLKSKNKPPPTSPASPTSAPSKTTKSKSSTSGTPSNPACTSPTWPNNSQISCTRRVGIAHRISAIRQHRNRETLDPLPTPPHLRHRRSHLGHRRRNFPDGRLHRHRLAHTRTL